MHMTCLRRHDELAASARGGAGKIASHEAKVHEKQRPGKNFPAVIVQLVCAGSGRVFEAGIECVDLSLAVALVREATKIRIAGEL